MNWIGNPLSLAAMSLWNPTNCAVTGRQATHQEAV
jgi:hypothetical protein